MQTPPVAHDLAAASGVPVVPAGLRFPRVVGRSIRDWDAMDLEIGALLAPPQSEDRKSVRGFHRQILRRISQLSGKALPADRDRNDLGSKVARPALHRGPSAPTPSFLWEE
ncbi:MAG: hypothetical protein AAF690_12430 [Acidobacteriota bacterium]